MAIDASTAHLVLGVLAFAAVAMVGLTIYFGERSYRALQHAIIQGQIELERGTRELRREVDEGLAELKRLDIVIGGMVYQEDEKIRALIIARFDEMLRLLPRS